MKKEKTREQIDSKYKWNLKAMYKSKSDWQKDLDYVNKACNEFKKYQGTLKDAQTILKLYNEVSKVSRKISNAYVYANLIFCEDLSKDESNQLLNQAYSTYVNFSSSIAFIDPELTSLPETKLNKIVNDKKLEKYYYSLQKLVKAKKHILSTKEETLLSQFSEVFQGGDDTASKLMDVDMYYDDVKDSKGKIHKLTNSNYGLMQESLDRTLRKNSFMSKYKTYKNHINTLASTYSQTVKYSNIEAKLRGFESSRQAKMFFDDIDEKVYDNLIKVVHNNLDKLQRYLKIRKKLLKIKDLHYYDLYAPLSGEVKQKYSFEKARDMVIDSVLPLGKDYQDIVRSAFKDGWIDVYPSKGKRGGAFSSGSYDSYPYIMLNHVDTLDSVSTLAHEMGHSMHSYLTRKNQPSHYSSYTMFVAEVASTVNENLLIEQMLENCRDDKLKLALLNQYLEGFKGTVYRQTLFAEFEYKAHKLAQSGQALTPDALNKIYGDLVKLYFGKDLIFDEEIKYEWSRIPHFYSPFYVYVYATGYTSAVSIAQDILSNKKDAKENYINFLKTGSSMPPVEELKLGGVDLTTPKPIQKALDKFNRVLDEVEKLIK